MSHSLPRHHALARTACQCCLALMLAGCSTWQAPAQTDIEAPRDRAVSETSHDVRTSAAVLGREDSMRMFGADVSKSGVQPLWVEVQNGTSQPLWLLRAGTAPDYYSPHEVAWSLHSTFGGATNASIDQDRHLPMMPSSIRPIFCATFRRRPAPLVMAAAWKA